MEDYLQQEIVQADICKEWLWFFVNYINRVVAAEETKQTSQDCTPYQSLLQTSALSTPVSSTADIDIFVTLVTATWPKDV